MIFLMVDKVMIVCMVDLVTNFERRSRWGLL